MDKSAKLKLKDKLSGDLKKTASLIIAEYRGLTVEEVTSLRVELKKSQAEFHVVKNRILKKAIEQDVPEMTCIKDTFTGPVGVVCVYGDAAQAAKVAVNFQKDHPNFVIKAGYLESAGLSAVQLKELADLPSKEELLARIVGSIVSPHRGLVTVLSGVSRQLVQVLNQIKEKKQ
jgi:large subunit ribosomal protein L10